MTADAADSKISNQPVTFQPNQIGIIDSNLNQISKLVCFKSAFLQVFNISEVIFVTVKITDIIINILFL